MQKRQLIAQRTLPYLDVEYHDAMYLFREIDRFLGLRVWHAQTVHTIRAWLARLPPGTTIIHGAARGADSLAGSVAEELGFTVRAYAVDHALDGQWPAAGPRRNARMLAAEPDVSRCFAFTDAIQRGTGASRRLTGTGDMVGRCLAAGVVVAVVPPASPPL
jgi:hypothetical protein